MASGGISSWISGFTSERSDVAPRRQVSPSRSRGAKDEIAVGPQDSHKSHASYKSGASCDTLAEERRDERRLQLERARQREHRRVSELDVPLDKSIPEEMQSAFRRSHAMCKQMIQAHEAQTIKRIEVMEEEIKNHGDFIADLGVQARTGRVSVSVNGSTHGEALSGLGRRSSASAPSHNSFDGDAEGIQSLKDDVQTVIDAMRAELQKQKETVTSLNEQVLSVQKGHRQSQVGSMFQGLSANLFGETGDSKDASEETLRNRRLSHVESPPQQLQQRHDELKKDIEKLGRRIEEAVADPQQYLSKKAFDEFSDKMERQFDMARKGLADVKNSQELVAVKAGFLAVAASECSREEKDGLFRSLKEQEEECYRKGIGSNPRITEC